MTVFLLMKEMEDSEPMLCNIFDSYEKAWSVVTDEVRCEDPADFYILEREVI